MPTKANLAELVLNADAVKKQQLLGNLTQMLVVLRDMNKRSCDPSRI